MVVMVAGFAASAVVSTAGAAAVAARLNRTVNASLAKVRRDIVTGGQVS
jgi:hypothetical protein